MPRAFSIAILIVAFAGCQVRVAVDSQLELDGRGQLTIGVGLDDRAKDRIGDLDRQVRLGDLEAAGWRVSPTSEGPDGLTWIRATRRFESIDEYNRALAELTAEPAMFRDFRLVTEDDATTRVHRLTGTIDPTRGWALFSDPHLGARLGGDPVAAQVAAIEQREGRKANDMVAFDVTTALGGEPGPTLHPRLDDRTPSTVEVIAREPKLPPAMAGDTPVGPVALVGMLVTAMLAGTGWSWRRPDAPT